MSGRKLYKVTVATDIMVMGFNKKEAEEIAKTKAINEISIYGEAEGKLIKHFADIPQNWKDVIPYAPDTAAQEERKCVEIFAEDIGEDVGAEDLEELVKLQAKAKQAKQVKPPKPSKEEKAEDEIRPETRPDPVSRELDWTETTSGRPLPPLRFNIPGK